MTLRAWLWLGTVLNATVFLPAAYMAMSAFEFVGSGTPPAIIGIAALFLALPVFCVVCPLASWRALKRGRDNISVLFLMAAPLVYAVFIAEFLFNG